MDQNPYTMLELSFYTVLLLILFSGGLAALITYIFLQKKQSLALQQLRINLSADLHDDAGALLAGLAMQLELLALRAQKSNGSKLNELAGRSRLVQARLRDIVWAYDARKDNWNSLLDRLNGHSQEVLAPKGIHFSFELKGVDRCGELPAAVRKEIYLIGKEAITNVSRHSNADEVTFCLENRDGWLHICIRDNGQVDKCIPSGAGSLGLTNIRVRAQRLGAQLLISHHQGFLIQLSMKAVA